MEKKSLAEQYPELAREWHPTKNGDLTPQDVTSGIGKKVWWQCEKGHEWQARIYSRSYGRSCPYCSGKKVLVGYNDLQTASLSLAMEWHPTKNGDLTPRDVTCGSGKKVWWMCEKGHEWQATVNNRSYGNSCPFCYPELKTSFPEKAMFYYLHQTFPDALANVKRDVFPWLDLMELDIYIPSLRLAVEYDGPLHFKKKDQRKNELCVLNNITIIRIRISKLKYELPDSINFSLEKENADCLKSVLLKIYQFISEKYGLAVNVDIDINRDRFKIIEMLKLRERPNSLALVHPELIAEWHPTKNRSLTPQKVTSGSEKKVWWQCEKGHEWQAVISSRSNGCGCPYCSGKKVLVGFNDLATTNPELAKEWHPTKNGDLTPQDITSGSGKKVWWMCEKGHEWQAHINNRHKGIGCPYCSGKKVLVGFNDLATTNPELAKEWHSTKNGDLTPQDVTSGIGKKVWWQCEKGHEWQARIYSRSYGSCCPICFKEKRKKPSIKG